MKIYVSNLGFSVQADDLKKLFATYGNISSVSVVMDKITNRSRGFAFVEMADNREAEKAIAALNGIAIDGRPIKVNEAKLKDDQRNKRSLY